MFGFLKKLKFHSGYSYTSAARRARNVVGQTAKEVFADGVAFGRSLEREEKKLKAKGRKWRGR